ncbi:MAG: O-antigen ligase family protein [bacterium]|nr:O-antigen ligase family protein [bacterium]
MNSSSANQHESRLRSASSLGMALLGFALPLSLVAVEIIAGVLLAIFIVRQLKAGKLSFNRLDLPVAVFVLIRLLSGIFSPHPELIGKGLTYLSFTAAYALTAWSVDLGGARNWRNFVRGLVLGGVVDSVTSLYQVADGVSRGIGLSGGWTILGNMTGAALVLGSYYAIRGGLFPKRYMDVMALGLIAAGLAASVCRAEWIAAFFVLLPAAVLYSRRFSALLGVGVLTVFLAVTPLRQRLMTITDPFSNLSGRDFIWRAAEPALAERPVFGSGLNSFHAVFPRWIRPWLVDTGPGDWHNLYLQVTVESGLIGLAALLWMLGSLLWRAYGKVKAANSPAEQALAWGLFAGLGFFCIAGGLSVFLVRIPVIILVFLIMGMISRGER